MKRIWEKECSVKALFFCARMACKQRNKKIKQNKNIIFLYPTRKRGGANLCATERITQLRKGGGKVAGATNAANHAKLCGYFLKKPYISNVGLQNFMSSRVYLVMLCLKSGEVDDKR